MRKFVNEKFDYEERFSPAEYRAARAAHLAFYEVEDDDMSLDTSDTQEVLEWVQVARAVAAEIAKQGEVELLAAEFSDIAEVENFELNEDSHDLFLLIAQYVVNGTGELPPHYSTARFWNENREHLLKCLTSLPNVREHFASTVSLEPHLTSVSRTLVSQLKKLRQELSLQYDVPIILGNRKRTA